MGRPPAGTNRDDRLVSLLLRLHPAVFRERFGESVRETHALRSAEARRAGRLAYMVFSFREYIGLAVSAWREHASVRRGMHKWPPGRGSRSRGLGEAAGEAMTGWFRESASAMRRLARTPGFTLASVLMLGMGIGASTAVYTIIHRVVLRPMPYATPDRLVWLDHGAPGYGFEQDMGIAVWQYLQYRESSRLLAGIALAQRGDVTLAEDGTSPERVERAVVTPSLAGVLGVAPVAGRWFDDSSSTDVLVSEGLWQRRWGGDASLLGRVIRLSGTKYRVIGVMPSGFAFPDRTTDLWTLREYTAAWGDGGFNYVGVGRMAEGTTLPAVQSELQALIQRAAEEFGDHLQVARRVAGGRIQARPVLLEDHELGRVRGTLWMVLAAVLLVLLTAWANVANLFLARADARRREVAVRRAIGAGRLAIARFFLAEGAILGGFSWLLGICLTYVTVHAIAGLAPVDLPRADEIAIDAHVLLIALALSVVAVLGLTAISQSQAGEAAGVLRVGRGTTAGRAPLRLRAGLMAGQVALALMLLAASGLLVRSWLNVRNTSPGFLADDALFFEVGLSSQDFPNRAQVALFHDGMAARLAALPGVEAVAYATCLPLDGYCWGEGVVPEGGTEADRVVVSMRRVSVGFFEAMQLPIIAGRAFGAPDGPRADAVVLSRQTATSLFPGRDAVGRTVNLGGAGPDGQWFRVIGVAADAATTSVMELRPELVFYLPIRDSYDQAVTLNRMSFILRTTGDPSALTPAVRAIMREASPETAVARPRTLRSVLAADRAQIALVTVLLLVAAVIALLLGAVGIHAVFAYVVGRRTAEFGLRLALGANARDVVGIVFRQAAIVTLVGFTFGLAGAAGLTRMFTSLLFGVQPLDPTVFLFASLVLLAIAFVAVLAPARRALRLRPVEALRTD